MLWQLEAWRALCRRGNGFKGLLGLDVCNSLERYKAYWHGCCRDGRKEACHDGPESLTVAWGLWALLAPAQFIVTKQGEEAQTVSAKYLATSAIMSKGQYSFEAECSLPCLTTLKAASAYQVNQSMLNQSSPNIMAPNHLYLLDNWAQRWFSKLLYHSPCTTGY